MKELSHLKRLSEVKSNSGVKFLTSAAFPGSNCPLHTALALSGNVKGMSTLVVGTPECGTYSRIVVSKSENAQNELHWMYILDSNEVVFGCRSGLIQAVREMDKAGAKAVMLLLTCVPEVIGEDIEGIVHEIQPQVSARLTYVQMGHFKCNSYPYGTWKTLLAFGSLMEMSQARSETINILGRGPEEDHIPMPVLLAELEKKGFGLRLLAPKSDIEDFIAAPDAKLNLVLSPFMNPLAEMMEKRYKVPFLNLHEAYDVCDIDNLYTHIAKLLRINWSHELFESRDEALSLHHRAKEVFNGLRYVMTRIGPLASLPLVRYLSQFQMKPLLLHLEEFYPNDRTLAESLNTRGMNPQICHMVNEDTDLPVIEHLAPDLCIGDLAEGKSTLPHVPHLYQLYGQIGYERTVMLLDRMLDSYKRSSQLKERRCSCGIA